MGIDLGVRSGEYGNTHLVKDVLELVLRQGRALDVLDSAQLLGHPLTILPPNGRHLLLAELVTHALVVAQIGLGADDEAGNTGAVVVDLGEPFLAHVLEGGGRGDGEADQEDVSLGVGKRTETIVILLPGGIEEAQSVRLVADPGRWRLV